MSGITILRISLQNENIMVRAQNYITRRKHYIYSPFQALFAVPKSFEDGGLF